MCCSQPYDERSSAAQHRRGRAMPEPLLWAPSQKRNSLRLDELERGRGMNSTEDGITRPILPAERRRLIAERIRAEGSVTVAMVGAEFGVSGMTARRDLASLESEGIAKRTHGGAVLPGLASSEDSFQSRVERSSEIKGLQRRLTCSSSNQARQFSSIHPRALPRLPDHAPTERARSHREDRHQPTLAGRHGRLI